MAERPAADHAPTALVHDELALRHVTGRGHPECPQRYTAILDAIHASPVLEELLVLPSRAATDEELLRVHTADYVSLAKREIVAGLDSLSTGDTTICSDTLDPALHATGAACAAVDAVATGRARNAFCVMRPPGHHATPDRGMGFCVFSNVAVGVRHAQAVHGAERVLVVDWDVHHGNGTQDVFYDDDSVYFFSTHQAPLYPGTGARTEMGTGRGEGFTNNHPFPVGAGRREIVGAFRESLVPAMEDFRPDFVFVSAGFDSRVGDPLGGFQLTDEDFVELTGILMEIAESTANGRLVSCLEGGYNLDGLAKAATAHCERLCQ